MYMLWLYLKTIVSSFNICIYYLQRPEKHGTEFLGILSKIFNESTDEVSSPAACLALDGVISLCKSEVNMHRL